MRLRLQRLALQATGLFGMAAVLIVGGRVSLLILFFVLARTADPAQFGLFTVTLATCQLTSLLATLGSAPAAQSIVAPAIARGRGRVARRYVGYAVLATSFGVALVSTAALLVGLLFPDPETVDVVYATALLSPVMAASVLREFVARAFEDTVMAFAPRDIVWSVLLAALVGTSPWIGRHLVVFATGLLAAVETVAWSLLWRKRVAPLPTGRRGPWAGKKWISRSLALMAHYLGGPALGSVDVIFVGALGDLVIAGVYGVASRLAPLMSVTQRFVVPVLAPRVARALVAGDRAALRNELWLGTLVGLSVAAPGILLLGWLAEPILALFGPRFVVGASALRILAIAHAAIALGAPFALVTSMGPNPWRSAVAVWAALAVSTIALPLAIQRFGLIGAATAVATGIIAYNAAMVALSLPALRGCPPAGK